jgi:hypothetical protein
MSDPLTVAKKNPILNKPSLASVIGTNSLNIFFPRPLLTGGIFRCEKFVGANALNVRSPRPLQKELALTKPSLASVVGANSLNVFSPRALQKTHTD